MRMCIPPLPVAASPLPDAANDGGMEADMAPASAMGRSDGTLTLNDKVGVLSRLLVPNCQDRMTRLIRIPTDTPARLLSSGAPPRPGSRWWEMGEALCENLSSTRSIRRLGIARRSAELRLVVWLISSMTKVHLAEPAIVHAKRSIALKKCEAQIPSPCCMCIGSSLCGLLQRTGCYVEHLQQL